MKACVIQWNMAAKYILFVSVSEELIMERDFQNIFNLNINHHVYNFLWVFLLNEGVHVNPTKVKHLGQNDAGQSLTGRIIASPRHIAICTSTTAILVFCLYSAALR